MGIQVTNEPLLVQLLRRGFPSASKKGRGSSSSSIKDFRTCLLENHRFFFPVKKKFIFCFYLLQTS
jgi:hypothetical protein